MKKEFKGLENKLEGVHVGDLLYLSAENGDKVAGFVREYNSTRVRLSHEPRDNSQSYGDWYFPKLTIGDREYPLSQFTHYKVMDLSDSTSE